MNELILLIILLLLVIIFLIIINSYSKELMTIYITFVTLISYILAFRNIVFIGMNLNANVVVYATIVPIIYYYIGKTKNFNPKDFLIKNALILLITFFLLMLTTGYIPSITDINAINIQNTFGNNFRTLIAYPLTLILSIYLTIILTQRLKDIYSNNFLTILILGSIITSMDIVLYNLISNSFQYPLIEILYIMAVTYIIRLIVIIIYAIIINNNLPKKKVKK